MVIGNNWPEMARMEAENESRHSVMLDGIKMSILADYEADRREDPELTLERYLMTRLIYAGPKEWSRVVFSEEEARDLLDKMKHPKQP